MTIQRPLTTGERLLRRLCAVLRGALSEVRHTTSGQYPVSLRSRHTFDQPHVTVEGVETFDSKEAQSINRARMQNVDSLGLELDGRSVVDVGSGPGILAQYFVQRGCDVLCLDAREENLARLRALDPSLRCQLFDLERQSLQSVAEADVVFSYGLLYHLENPFRAIRELCGAAREVVLLETMVVDSSRSVVVMDEETATVSQALHGVGCRPSPSYVALAMRESGFAHVYAPRRPPEHPDFEFSWRDDLSTRRDEHPLRCVFVGSRRALDNEALVSLIQTGD